MLDTSIPYNYIEIEDIVKKLEEKKVNFFLSTQKEEGVRTLLDTLSNNLISKNKNVAIIDLSTFMQLNHFSDLENIYTVFNLDNNVFVKKEIKDRATYFFFKHDKLSTKDKINFLDSFSEIMKSIEKDYDYILLKNAPISNINKNNIQTDEIYKHSKKTFFILRSNYVSKLKMENIKNILTKNKINISGIIINDYGTSNLFEEIIKTIYRIKYLFPRKIFKKIILKLKEYKYDNQL